ncbi:substrate-binding periplasmic protein [Rhodovibrionaceae bacterium A322]
MSSFHTGFLTRPAFALVMGFCAVLASAQHPLAASSERESARETISVASIDWCPQLCTDQQKPGYVMETLEAVFQDSPYDLSIEIFPWSRAISATRSGTRLGLLSPAKAEAPDLRFPQQPVGIQRMCFFTTAKSDWRYSNVDSLQGKFIALAADSSIEELNDYLRLNPDRFHTMVYSDRYVATALRMLENNRIDAFLFTYNTTVSEIARLNLTGKFRSAGCVATTLIYFAFTADPTQQDQVSRVMAFFDQKMAELRASGEVARIMQRYGLEDWQALLN